MQAAAASDTKGAALLAVSCALILGITAWMPAYKLRYSAILSECLSAALVCKK